MSLQSLISSALFLAVCSVRLVGGLGRWGVSFGVGCPLWVWAVAGLGVVLSFGLGPCLVLGGFGFWVGPGRCLSFLFGVLRGGVVAGSKTGLV